MKQIINDRTLSPSNKSFTNEGDTNGVSIGATDVAAVTCDKNKASKCDEVRHNVNCSDTNTMISDGFVIIF